MLRNLLVGLPIMAVCLLLQSLLFLVAMRYYSRQQSRVDNPSFWSSLAVINGVMLLLLVGNLAQLTIWAVLFKILGEFDSLREAVYHSAVNFTTLGYGDIVMSTKNRFLGPLEAINGMLMIGVTTAALLAAFQDAMKKTKRARQG